MGPGGRRFDGLQLEFLPYNPVDDSVDMRMREIEGGAKTTGGFSASVPPSDLADGIRLQSAVVLSARVDATTGTSVGGMGVAHVVSMAQPLQVIRSVVRAVKVLVVHGRGFIARLLNKRSGDESMHAIKDLLTASDEVAAWVTFAQWGAKNLSARSLAVSLDPVKGPNSPKVRDLIEAFVPDDRSPLFCGGILFGSHRASAQVAWSGLWSALITPRSPFCFGGILA